MSERVIASGPAGCVSIGLLLAGLASPVVLYFTLGPAPCRDESWFYDVTRLAVPLALMIGSILIYRTRHGSALPSVLAALAVPAVAIGLNAVAARAETVRQTECSKWDLQSAMAHCGAKAAHYRTSFDQHGNSSLTLVAPGTTDQVWNCLWNWQIHNGSVSMRIDERVYEHYRRVHGKP